MRYLGLDTAGVTGIAVYDSVEHTVRLSQVEGDPIDQLAHVLFMVNRDLPPVFVMERIHHFRNATTTRSLLERYGFLKWSLLDKGWRVEEVAPRVARRFLGAKGKDGTFNYFKDLFMRYEHTLSTHQTDALAVALYQASLDGFEFHKEMLMIV